MKPANNLRPVVERLWTWSSLHEEWGVLFSSCAWKGPEGLILVDPIELDPAGQAKLEHIDRPCAVLLTNENHERQAEAFRERYRIPIHVHRDAVPGIRIKPDGFFVEGDVLPGGLQVVRLPGASPSESAFHTAASGGIVIAGDALLHLPQGLAFLPDEHCQDGAANRASVGKLLGLAFETLTLAHGDPISPGARDHVARLVAAGG